MVDVSAIALSGVYANEKRIAVAADNIANLQSANYNAKKVDYVSNPAGGVSAQVADKNPATVPVPNSEGGIDQRPNVSLEEELVGVNIAANSVQANLKVLQAQDKMNKYLLDIQA